ncbi:DUF3500 domain-containing protein [Arcticibacterium luteifluviistationis]|uniref:DUF3500 domain-containing protein n=1 Tax=Arcticibacterium luteifluviistationis TaxID=1784714 RepID=A0A2Z4G9Q8_9BACT|nr:DUF3500 domain-containing protein [Arcticibacterium luteifluviistationis]AWV97926.1 hypothetical protein DJ013_06990 [Arcticibacterium luteifluviistationis]
MKKLILVLLIVSMSTSFAQKNANADILKASEIFLASLSSELKSEAQFEFESPERKTWFYTPVPRKGLDYRKLSDQQKLLAKNILKASLSKTGYETALAIMQLEAVLKVLEKLPEANDHRDPEKYYFSFFGTPDQNETWAWRIEGHHLSLNYSSENGKIDSATPLFFGTNPAYVPANMPLPEGTMVLKDETGMGLAFLASLNKEQHDKAKVNDKAPYDVVTSNKALAQIKQNEGLSFNQMTKPQQVELMKIISHHIKRSPNGFANELMQKTEQAGLENLHFVWMGGEKWGEGHYYRIHNPVLLIEYDCTQNNNNHVHSVVRDLTNDWGEDVIANHIKNDH